MYGGFREPVSLTGVYRLLMDYVSRIWRTVL